MSMLWVPLLASNAPPPRQPSTTTITAVYEPRQDYPIGLHVKHMPIADDAHKAGQPTDRLPHVRVKNPSDEAGDDGKLQVNAGQKALPSQAHHPLVDTQYIANPMHDQYRDDNNHNNDHARKPAKFWQQEQQEQYGQLRGQQLPPTCSQAYGSYFIIATTTDFLGASTLCQSYQALPALINSLNYPAMLDLYTWCSIGNLDNSAYNFLYPWVSGSSIAGNCPLLASDNTVVTITTTSPCEDPERQVICQSVYEQVQTFSQTTTTTTGTVTVTQTLSTISTSITLTTETDTAPTIVSTTVTLPTLTDTVDTTTVTSSVLVPTSTSTTTGVFPSPQTTTVSTATTVTTVTIVVTGILQSVTTQLTTTTSFQPTTTYTQVQCSFLVNPTASTIQ
jgi:hypothetical protein